MRTCGAPGRETGLEGTRGRIVPRPTRLSIDSNRYSVDRGPGEGSIAGGLTCTAGVLLLLAAFVAGAETRSTLLIALALVVFFGGGFPLVVARGDRGVKVFADGTLERADWGGVSTVDLRRYERVTLD